MCSERILQLEIRRRLQHHPYRQECPLALNLVPPLPGSDIDDCNVVSYLHEAQDSASAKGDTSHHTTAMAWKRSRIFQWSVKFTHVVRRYS